MSPQNLAFVDGHRLAFIDDSVGSRRLSESKLLQMSGGGEIPVRGLQEQLRTADVTATTVFICNPGFEPRFSTTSQAMFERVHVLDWEPLAASQDDAYSSLFYECIEARQAFVSMVVQAGVGLTHKPTPPESIRESRLVFRDETDGEAGSWLRDSMQRGEPYDFLFSATLWDAAVAACGADPPWGMTRIALTKLAKKVVGEPVTKPYGKKGRGFRGYRLRSGVQPANSAVPHTPDNRN